jgi:hypothetical protein
MQMKGFICALLVGLAFPHVGMSAEQSHTALRPLVYFITGGPAEFSIKGNTVKLAPLREFLAANYPATHFRMVHNTHGERIYDEVVAMKNSAPTGPLILLTHSYGAAVGVEIARRFEKVGVVVDLMVTVDMIRKPGIRNPEIIPENVATLHNFFESKDIMLRGRKNLRRPDNSHRGITNTEVSGPFVKWPHHDLLRNLINDGVIVGLIHETLSAGTVFQEVAAGF